jgi:metallo-beta-lactamase family protein
MKIKFCGAAEGVTGSCHLITAGAGDRPLRVLLDCGQLQGGREIEEQNADPFPFEASDVDFVILSHAHIDHCGRLPLLVSRGYEGVIYCTEATADLIGIMLRDSAYIHEKEAEWRSRKAVRAGKPPVAPLYTLKDAEAAIKRVVGVPYGERVEAADGCWFVLSDAGHIIGSAIVELWVPDASGLRKVVFSGDLGQENRPILEDPDPVSSADVVVMESTYGGRFHGERDDSGRKLAEVIVETAERGGTVVIPSFAVGRAQELIYEFNDFYENNARNYALPGLSEKLQSINVYLDSPMAIAATEVFKRNANVFDDEYRDKTASGDDPLDFFNLRFTATTEESKALNESDEPKVIISASGMCEAGRIRHHLKHHLWRGKDSVVFVGYQAEGTLGRNIVDGAKLVKLFGDDVYVNAHVYDLQGFSAHADHGALVSWAKGFTKKPSAMFLVHGETQSKEALADDIEKQTGMRPTIVKKISEFTV